MVTYACLVVTDILVTELSIVRNLIFKFFVNENAFEFDYTGKEGSVGAEYCGLVGTHQQSK